MIRKLLITPYFGPLPEWMSLYERNIARLAEYGYDRLVCDDLDGFKERVWDTLGVDCPIQPGTGKIHDYRCAFGEVFAEELEGYDFWGHTDFDCVYGRVQEYMTDGFLSDLDIYSNHWNYICGPWTLYRNCPAVNTLFRDHPDWEEILESDTTTGWVEKEYTHIVDAHHEAGNINRVYKLWHTYENFSKLHWRGEKLMDGGKETMMVHFRRSKEYPEQLK